MNVFSVPSLTDLSQALTESGNEASQFIIVSRVDMIANLLLSDEVAFGQQRP